MINLEWSRKASLRGRYWSQDLKEVSEACSDLGRKHSRRWEPGTSWEGGSVRGVSD